MKFTRAVDTYLFDLQRMGRLNSPHSEVSYRTKLTWLAEDIGNRDPAKVGRDDIKRFLSRWQNPNSQAQAHAIVASFFDYAIEEGWRTTNPARQVRRARRKQPSVYRMTLEEVQRFLEAANLPERRRDRWVAYLGCCAGLRSQELRGLQGRHLLRPGWVWVSPEIAKGGRARWVPVLSDLEPVVEEILTLIGLDEYVVPGRRTIDPPFNTKTIEDPYRMMAATTLYRQVIAIGERAQIAGKITPHLMRHAYGDHIARYAGLRVAQALMGHESVETTAGTYTDRPSLDELAAQVRGFSFYRPVIALPTETEGEAPHG